MICAQIERKRGSGTCASTHDGSKGDSDQDDCRPAHLASPASQGAGVVLLGVDGEPGGHADSVQRAIAAATARKTKHCHRSIQLPGLSGPRPQSAAQYGSLARGPALPAWKVPWF